MISNKKIFSSLNQHPLFKQRSEGFVDPAELRRNAINDCENANSNQKLPNFKTELLNRKKTMEQEKKSNVQNEEPNGFFSNPDLKIRSNSVTEFSIEKSLNKNENLFKKNKKNENSLSQSNNNIFDERLNRSIEILDSFNLNNSCLDFNSKQISMNIEGYLQPLNNNWTLDGDIECKNDFSFPFPFPNSGLIKSRTDLLLDESSLPSFLSETSLTMPKLEQHSYVNQINNECLLNSRNENRKELLKDFLNKQNDYMLILRLLYEEYYRVLANSSNVTNEDLTKIFSNVNEIYIFHEENFSQDLDLRFNEWNNQLVPIVCDLFQKHLEKIKLYDYFIENLKENIKFIDYLYESHHPIKSKLEEIDKKMQKNYINQLTKIKLDNKILPTIKTFLIYLQTWPDLANKFLIAYENYLTIEHLDFKYFDEIIQDFNNLATKSVEAMEEAKQLEILKNLQKRIGKKFNILDKKRILLKEGPLITQSPHLGSIIRIYIILLNDLLIICDLNQNEFDQLRPKRPLETIGISVSSDVNAFTNEQSRIKFPSLSKKDNLIEPEKGISINVPCVQKVFKFYARNLQEKNKWLNAFMHVAQASKYEIEIDRTNIGKKQPKFIPEKLSPYCFKCKSEFNTMNRKHHCKACGYIFCQRCSKMQASLEYENGKKNRVCDFCYDSLYHTFRSKPPSLEQINQRFIEPNKYKPAFII